MSLQIVNVFKEILKQNLKRIVNKHSGYIFAEKYFFLIHFRKKNVNVIVNDVKGLTTRYKRLVIFEVAHCATWQNPLKKCCFSKNISKTHLNVGVLFDKRSRSKYSCLTELQWTEIKYYPQVTQFWDNPRIIRGKTLTKLLIYDPR